MFHKKLLSPDKFICENCLKEYLDVKNNRRYFYPFIGCNQCGMYLSTGYYEKESFFKICNECEKEYRDSFSRRYNYPFVCCKNCGPKIHTINFDFENYEDLFQKISELLDQGEVLILKTTNMFYFIVDSTNENSIKYLREVKKTFKPLPVAFRDYQMLKEFVIIKEEVETEKSLDIKVIEYQDLKIKEKGLGKHLGVYFANDPFFIGIFQFFDRPIVFSSVNISGQAPYRENHEVIEQFSKKIKYFILHDLDIKLLQDFSIIYNKWDICIRRGIGRTGKIIETEYSFRDSICLGPELESSISFSKDNKIFISSRLGHLVNQHVFDNYKKLLENLTETFKIDPEMIICDLHPYYLSTSLAKQISQTLNLPLKQVQHHKAHIYSLIIDRKIQGDIIGFSFDGTGYGEDGKIWGGEVFVGNLHNLSRVAHFKYIPIVGGDSAIENPVFIALSYISKYLPQKIDLFRQVNSLQREIILKQVENSVNIYWTSSVGRLFDIAAVLLKIREDSKISFSGQAAMELESLALTSHSSKTMPFDFIYENEIINIDFFKTFEYILANRDYENYSDLAKAFHNTIVEAIYQLAIMLRDKYGINKVGFSGGVFQNKILIYLINKTFKDFEIYFHKDISPNDSGISVGQLQAAFVKNQ